MATTARGTSPVQFVISVTLPEDSISSDLEILDIFEAVQQFILSDETDAEIEVFRQ